MQSDYYNHLHTYLNVVFLDDDPMLSAQQYCDIDVGSKIFSVCKILSRAWALERRADDMYTSDWVIPRKEDGSLFNDMRYLRVEVCGNQIYSAYDVPECHPCVTWARLYGGNYDWLYQLGCHLLDEYTFRFDRLHSSAIALRALEVVPPSLVSSLNQYCDSPSLMPSDVSRTGAIESYRNYYRQIMHRALRYTKRRPPEWVADISTYYKEQQ